MINITLDELKEYVIKCKQNIQDNADNVGRCVKVYDHWSAGHYGQFFDDYHVNIDSDGSIYLSTEDLSSIISHTYHRNTGAIGVALACCAGATSNNLGDEPPTNIQLETMYKVNAVILSVFGFQADIEHLMTHGEAADNEDGVYASEPYGPKSTCERWDLEFLGTEESPSFDTEDEDHRGGRIIRGKSQWYIDQGV